MSMNLGSFTHSPGVKIFFSTKLDVHRREFPEGAQITTVIKQSRQIKLLECKIWIVADNCRSSRPTSGIPVAVQVLLIFSDSYQ